MDVRCGTEFNYKEVYFQNQCFPFFSLLSFSSGDRPGLSFSKITRTPPLSLRIMNRIAIHTSFKRVPHIRTGVCRHAHKRTG